MLFMLLFFLVSRYGMRRGTIRRETAPAHGIVMAVLGAGLVLRLVIAWNVYGYDADVNTFKAWADHAASAGLMRFYTTDMFVDYPPGYIYVLYIIGVIRSALHISWDSSWALLLLKSPAMLTDLLTSYLIFRWGSRHAGGAAALGAAVLYLLNPAIIVNSAGWGQVDSFFMLWMLLFIEAVLGGRLRQASAYYAVALLIKPQALLFAPLLLLVFIRRGSWKSFLASFASGLAVFSLLAAPFLLLKGPLWIFSLYFGTLSSYPYASLNAYNIMTLLGGNFAPITDQALFLTFQSWSVILMACVLLYTVYLYLKSSKDEKQLAIIAGILMTGTFVVLTKMHERYLYYALLFILLGFLHLRDRRLLYCFLGLSLTHFINVDQVLLGSLEQLYHIPPDDAVLTVVSLANVMLFLYLCRWAWQTIVLRQMSSMASLQEDEAARSDDVEARIQTGAAAESESASAVGWRLPEPKPLNWGRKDTLLLGGLVLVYSVLALYHLGSAKAPETGWLASREGEQVLLDLGESKPIERINSFSGVGDGSFTYEISADGQTWSRPIHVSNDIVKVFMWQVVSVHETGRYVKLTVERPSFTLNELAVYASGSEIPVPVLSIKGENMDPPTKADTVGRLIDEPSQASYRSTYMNGTYFDEIYHARTAYEHLHHLEPYEWTHPPLGKLLISIGIMVFGMNPFGWRIVGTLFGIAMIPLMYLLGKRMFGRSEYAFVSSFLLTVDGLHFVQTRIATIDVYGVFFILLMFYFMYRYVCTRMFAEDWRKSLVLLALCGLFFGIGAASKWIVLYAGSGLALIFFLWLFWHYRVYAAAGKGLASMNSTDPGLLAEWKHIRNVFPRRTLVTLAVCIVFYILIPMVTYVLSYIPFMLVPGTGHGLAEVWSYQKQMLDYHSQLKGTHPFSSSWWQWPVMSRPVWYYGATELPPGTISSIVAIGNPLVWWGGFLAILLFVFRMIKSREATVIFIVIAFFSQYIPWMFVPRMTFIYHYFGMVPFSILAVTYYYRQIKESQQGKIGWMYGYLAAAALCFVLFYPILSGLVIDRSYAEHVLKWFPQWQFF
ncbi:glycosyltransferase family 39 protein [Paenibacillus sp. OAS669]|uniref:glycosyltransferase family 39 protein n=1 Tax=Paenibacillus sp. OAS669 TaxID=2663821 RepID=UPI0017891478|nr:glycosyltransferase family 39 protein [Paenibacillus sp. OAS669]MBE1441697.1 Gpi18-like mannosyltransferase/predicted membrane-bound dolichyl-phosphate-mannose-protein mannosyltransferase [Paenibacillus sp. OAS669]